MHITMRSSDVIERLKNVSVRDGLLVYHIWLKSQLSMAELYPMYPPHLVDKEYELTVKLYDDAFTLYKAQQRQESAIFKSYTSIVEDKFPEFDSRIIWRYFNVAKSGFLMGTYPFNCYADQEEVASLCLSLGEYSSAALMDRRCSFVSELRNTDVKQALSDNYLYKLFPHLLQEQERLVQIQNKINSLLNYCKFIVPNLREEISNDLQDKKDQLEQQNLGFHSASYKLAWDWAQAVEQDWKYMSFDPELENFFAPFESSTQTKD